MISFLIAVSSKVVVDSILAGAGLGMAIYKTAKTIANNNNRKK